MASTTEAILATCHTKPGQKQLFDVRWLVLLLFCCLLLFTISFSSFSFLCLLLFWVARNPFFFGLNFFKISCNISFQKIMFLKRFGKYLFGPLLFFFFGERMNDAESSGVQPMTLPTQQGLHGGSPLPPHATQACHRPPPQNLATPTKKQRTP